MGRFIVDTSVWIDFFRGQLEPSDQQQLTEGIRLRVAAVTDIIRHEILVGAKNQKDYHQLQQLLGPLDLLRIREEELAAFDQFSWNLKRIGFKGKYTDASIAFVCHSRDLPLMTFDSYFQLLRKNKILRIV